MSLAKFPVLGLFRLVLAHLYLFAENGGGHRGPRIR